MLSKYNKFYDSLVDIVPTLEWLGFRLPVETKPNYYSNRADFYNSWGECIFERLGLPIYYSADKSGVACLEGKSDLMFNDNELKELFSTNLLISSDSAEAIYNRGFGEYLGVKVEKWEGQPPIIERICDQNKKVGIQHNIKALNPICDNVEVLSEVLNTKDNVNYDYLFPGVTHYINKSGGSIYVFSGIPNTPFNYMAPFSYLNLSRKKQFIDILKSMNQPLLYYPGDEEVYFKAAKRNNGGYFISMINIGFDKIEDIEIAINQSFSSVNILSPDGLLCKVPYERTDLGFKTNIQAETLEPIILLID